MARKRPAASADPKNSVAPEPPRPNTLAFLPLLFCATLVAYWPAIQGGLLWDDEGHVTRPDLQSLHGLWRIWFDLGATQQYYPVLHSAFWIEHRLWGGATLGYHLTNIALHSISAFLLVLIVRRLAMPRAWLAGFLFALHPVCVEAVAWISEQKSTLSGVFYLGAALAYLHFDGTRRKSRYLVALGLFVLALLSKTVTATLPAALLVLLWWQRGRLEWKRDVLPLVPWFAVGVPAGLFTAWVERTYIGAHGADFALTPVQHILLAGRDLWFYFGELLWPGDLTFSYRHWALDPHTWWQDLFPAGILLATIGLVMTARRSRGPLASFLIFAGTLFPVLGFLHVFPFRYSWVADHFQYLASVGILAPAAWLLAKVRHIAVPVVVLAVLGLLTVRQSAMYTDSETLYRETLARNPDSFLAHNNLGLILFARRRMPEAVAEYQAALRIKPDYTEAHFNLGAALAQMPGRLPDSIAQFEAALHDRPDLAEVHANLANALSLMPGRMNDAIAEYRAALRIRPDYASAHSNLGAALAEMPGRLPDAIAEYQAALRINPDMAEVHFNLAQALSQMPGRASDAIAEYEAALRLRPDLEAARQSIQQLRSQVRP